MAAGHPQNALWGDKGAVARGIVQAMERRWHTVSLPRSWRYVMAVVRGMPEWLFQRFPLLAGR